MITGIYLDPRTWEIDFKNNNGWNPNKFGLNIILYDENSQKNKIKLPNNCKFVIASEVWTPAMQETLEWISSNGLKVFMLPREIVLAESYRNVMFHYKECKYKNKFFYNPDVVLSPGDHYSSFWSEKTRVINVGHPKFDWYFTNQINNKQNIKKKFNIKKDKIIFFPAYWDKHYQFNGKKVVYTDIGKDLKETMEVLEQTAVELLDTQIIVKIHPTTQKLVKKGKCEFDNITKKYIKKDGLIKIIEDERNNGNIPRELLNISDLVLGFKSTMMLEAVVIGIPVLNIMFEQAQKLIGLPDIIKKTKTVYNKKDLIEILIAKEYKKLVHNKDEFSEYFYIADGNFCKRVCEAIKNNI